MTDTISPKEGHYYKDRLGRVHGPMYKYEEFGWNALSGRIDQDDVYDWYLQGNIYSEEQSEYDLIEEVSDCDEELNPIRTVTTIIAGEYGRLRVDTVSDDVHQVYLELIDDQLETFDVEDIRNMIKSLTALADFMEKNSK